MLEGKNITKKFGGLSALSNLSFKVDKNEIVGLIGPNGSGKTTLFNTISGLYKPDEGSLFLKGINITRLKPYQIARMGLGRTFQIVQPFEEMTVLENVAIGSLYGAGEMSIKKAKARAIEILEFVEMKRDPFQMASDLTLPDRKRLEVARALATRPDIILLDEVFAGLNETEINEAIALIFKIRDKMGITVFMVEHVLSAIMKTCSRVIVLDYGQKLAEGTPQEVANNSRVIEAYLGGAVCSK
jgi:branched-chain amino acid transport system ATP-binding protein